MNQQKIGEFLKHLRKEQGLTQEQLAEAFYVSSRTVSRWETGSNMPDLEILILSGSPITDISSLAGATKLEWLELTFCDYLVDISVLKNLTSLRFLNIGYTDVADISSIQDLPLERFHALRTKVPTEDFKAYIESHPDCWTTYKGSRQPYGKGWRYDDAGYTFFEYYAKMRDIFEYDRRA